MKVTKQHNVIITLELTQEESQWLNGVMQNPLTDADPEFEDENDKRIRERFFLATKTTP